MTDLTQEKCVPCEGGVKPLTEAESRPYLVQVPDWQIQEGNRLVRDFSFADFAAALAFVNSVGAIAEQEGHHPDLLLFGYKNVRITLSTHAIGGLSRNDFIEAAKINRLV